MFGQKRGEGTGGKENYVHTINNFIILPFNYY
jgi:hypothetical protein